MLKVGYIWKIVLNINEILALAWDMWSGCNIDLVASHKRV